MGQKWRLIFFLMKSILGSNLENIYFSVFCKKNSIDLVHFTLSYVHHFLFNNCDRGACNFTISMSARYFNGGAFVSIEYFCIFRKHFSQTYGLLYQSIRRNMAEIVDAARKGKFDNRLFNFECVNGCNRTTIGLKKEKERTKKTKK